MSLEELAQLATVVGAFSVPFAIFLFLWDRHKHRQARELATYTELAKEYRAFLQLCLDYPDLQIDGIGAHLPSPRRVDGAVLGVACSIGPLQR